MLDEDASDHQFVVQAEVNQSDAIVIYFLTALAFHSSITVAVVSSNLTIHVGLGRQFVTLLTSCWWSQSEVVILQVGCAVWLESTAGSVLFAIVSDTVTEWCFFLQGVDVGPTPNPQPAGPGVVLSLFRPIESLPTQFPRSLGHTNPSTMARGKHKWVSYEVPGAN